MGSSKRSLVLVLAAGGIALIGQAAAHAEDKPACEQFDWSIKREQALFGSPELRKEPSGAVLDGTGALALELGPMASVPFVLPPARQPKSPDSFGGVLTVRNLPAAGVYEVTLSAGAWIDVIQDGHSRESAAHTGKSSCADVRKSVRFALQPGAATIQISGASANVINVAVLPAE